MKKFMAFLISGVCLISFESFAGGPNNDEGGKRGVKARPSLPEDGQPRKSTAGRDDQAPKTSISRWYGQLPQDAPDYVVNAARQLLTDDDGIVHRDDLIKTLLQVPTGAFAHFPNLFTDEMEGKIALLAALAKVPAERVDLVINEARKRFTDDMDGFEKGAIIKVLGKVEHEVTALIPGFNLGTFKNKNPRLVAEFIAERGEEVEDREGTPSGKRPSDKQKAFAWDAMLDEHLQDSLLSSFEDATRSIEEIERHEKIVNPGWRTIRVPGYSWNPNLPVNFDWVAFGRQNPELEPRFINARAKNGLKEGQGLTNGQITDIAWVAKYAAWLQAVAHLSMQGREKGYSWLWGLKNFDWKEALTRKRPGQYSTLMARYKAKQLARTAEAKTNGNFARNPGDYIQEKDFNPDGSLKPDSGFIRRQAEWVQTLKLRGQI